MKTKLITICAAVIFINPLSAQQIIAEFQEIDNFTDFSVYGLSEERTLKIFETEFEDEMKRAAEKYLNKGETLTITFTDIDMAGDIQPWRNRHNADIRYIEDVYPPRMEFSFVLKNEEGEVLMEGEDKISDLSYQMNSLAPMRTQYLHFFYETELLKKWARKTLKKR